jgi:hypothetical protein
MSLRTRSVATADLLPAPSALATSYPVMLKVVNLAKKLR